ncbi:HipA domain-containing protein [Rhodobacter capsulatus]|uniref:HipA domain-containing protein n=1 Tax=Rhodobacter capsulatus TaxID=1061 RepID=UPI004024DE7C
MNLLLGNTDNHAKNHALLYTGVRPVLAPVYDVAPVLIDRDVTHQLAFDIGRAQMTDEITAADLEDFILSLGFPRFTPALRKRLIEIVQTAVAEIAPMRGPALKPLGDAMAEQGKRPAIALVV